MNVFLDIETLPTNDPEVIAEFSASITAPAQYKKPESIEQWLVENREAALAEKIAKTSFDGLYGRIACIAWAFDDGQVLSTDATDSETDCLAEFFQSIRDYPAIEYNGGTATQPLTFVGHNIAGFDIPFIKHRAIILGVTPPSSFRMAMSARPWGSEVADTMLMWSQDREKRASMDKLCRAFGIPGKGEFDGSMVAATWTADPKKVISYCTDDVRRTREIYKRLTFQEAAK